MADNASKVLIVGLGNPGDEFSRTRHNTGFMAVDFLVGNNEWKKEKNYLVFKSDNLIFIKPLTFMNLSGIAVQAAMAKYKIPIENIVVIHDDIDLKLSDIRIKTGGGNAGHNGLKSITGAIGNDYRRVRIGVGRPEIPEIDVSDWVVGRFTKSELSKITETITKLPDKL